MAEHVLVTGGAGFIGSHLADELLRAGHRVRVLDSLVEQVHGQAQRPGYLDEEAELIAGDVRDADVVRGALEGVDSVVHLAARVGVGQSMYEPAEYAAANTAGTGVLLEALLDHPVRKLVVASSMSIYGEGAYEPAPAQERTREQLERGDWEPRGPNGEQLEPVPTPETKEPSLASIYALTKYDQERMCLLYGSGLRRAGGRAALLQRLRPAPGALEPLHRRARDLRLAPAERPRAGRLRGRRPAARLRQRRRRRPRLHGSRSSATAPTGSR